MPYYEPLPISQLATDTTITGVEQVVLLDNPGSNPVTKKATLSNILASLTAQAGRPGTVYTSATATTPVVYLKSEVDSLLEGFQPIINGIGVPQGGTGRTSLPLGHLLIGNGEQSINTLAPGANGQVLTVQNGSLVWSSVSFGKATASVSGTVRTDQTSTDPIVYLRGTVDSLLATKQPVITVLPVEQGGTGATTLPLGALLLGNGTSGLTALEPGPAGTLLISDGETWSALGAGAGNPFAPLASPVFTGIPQAPDPLTSDDSNQLATTHYVRAIIGGGSLQATNVSSTAVGNVSATTVQAAIGQLDSYITGEANTRAAADAAQTLSLTTGISTLQSQINTKAPLANPAFTGTVTAPTAAAGNATTIVANTAFVQAAINSALTGGSIITAINVQVTPVGSITATDVQGALAGTDTRLSQEITARLNADSAANSAIADRAPIISPTFTGLPSAPTATSGTNTTQIATTAFVEAVRVALVTADSGLQTQINLKAPLNSPTLTGTPTAPTVTDSTDTTAKLATTAFVQAAIQSAVVNGATTAQFVTYVPVSGGVLTGGNLQIVGQQTDALLRAKADLAGPVFTGSAQAPTATQGSNSTLIATTAFVQTAIGALGIGNYAPLTSPNFQGSPTAPTPATGNNTGLIATTAFVQASLGNYSGLASPAFTGVPTAPTAAPLTSTTQLATTAFVSLALTDYAPLASPTFTGLPNAPTVAAANDNTTRIATTAFVQAAIQSAVVNGATSAQFVSYNPLAAGNVGGTNVQAALIAVDNLFNNYAPLASPTLTGVPAAPTAVAGTNTTQIATTAFTQAALAPFAPLASPVFTGTPTAPTPIATDNSTKLSTTAFVRSVLTAANISNTAYLSLTTTNLQNTLNLLGAVVQLSVIDHALSVPPSSPASGAVYLVAPGGTGAWASRDGSIAVFNGVSYDFYSPRLGWQAWTQNGSRLLSFTGASWAPLIAPLSSPSFTGSPTAPTAATSDNSQLIATTAFVKAVVGAASGGSNITRQTITFTTPSVAAGATFSTTVAIAASFHLLRVALGTGQVGWIKFYNRQDNQTADAGRGVSTAPAGGSGVLHEFVLPYSGRLYINPSPAAFLYNAEDSVSANVPISVTNTDTVAHTYTVTMIVLPAESA